MTTTLYLAPAGGGKTQTCLKAVHNAISHNPLACVWVIMPDRNQAYAFQSRLAALGGGMGVSVGTFSDLYRELLGAAGCPFPVAPEALIHKLVELALQQATEMGELRYYQALQQKPGFVRVLADLFAELKRSRVTIEQLSLAVQGKDQRLRELAGLYDAYQNNLTQLGWADHEGLGWLATKAIEEHSLLASDWSLLVVDGFDSFNPTQLHLLRLLTARVRSAIITLAGDGNLNRMAHRRFIRTRESLDQQIDMETRTLPPHTSQSPSLAHLERYLFEANPQRYSPHPQSKPIEIEFIEAQNIALEAREGLRWIKAQLVRGHLAANECAIIAHDIELYRPYLREAAREFGIPLHITIGEPLRENPSVSAAIALLELPVRNWARRPLIDVLSTPYFDLSGFGLSQRDAAVLSEVARAGQIIEGLDQWLEALEQLASEPPPETSEDEEIDDEELHPPQRPLGMAAKRLSDNLRGFAQRLTPPSVATMVEYTTWAERLLTERGGVEWSRQAIVQQDTAERDTIAGQKLSTILKALVLADNVIGKARAISYGDFFAALLSLVEAASYTPHDDELPRATRVLATDASDARGVRYGAVALLGLSEGLFPTPLAEDPLLPDEERADLGEVGLPIEPRLRSDQQTLFYDAVTRADKQLLLSRPYLAEDGESWEPSPFWKAALALFPITPSKIRMDDERLLDDAASPQELLSWAVKRRALPRRFIALEPEWLMLRRHAKTLRARLASPPNDAYEGDLGEVKENLAARYGPQHTWSASRLETYGACPFRFFIESALGLEERKPPEPGYDAAQLGSMLHQILELVYKTAGDTSSLEELLALLRPIGLAVFDRGPKEYGFRPTPLWEVHKAEMLETLAKGLEELTAQNQNYRPAHFELRFGGDSVPPLRVDTTHGSVALRGVIDRVDTDTSGTIRVIDYKTGSGGFTAKDLVEGKRLQLPLYALACVNALGLGVPAEGFYWSILATKVSQLRLSTFAYTSTDGECYVGAAGAMELCIRHIGHHVNAIREGQFWPQPAVDGCPEYCVARLFCWRYHRGARP